MGLANLERKGRLQVLLFLYNWKNPKPANMSDILSEVHIHNETLTALVDFLEELNFVKQEKTATFPQQHIVYLTEQGQVVARHLAAIANDLEPPLFPTKKKLG